MRKYETRLIPCVTCKRERPIVAYCRAHFAEAAERNCRRCTLAANRGLIDFTASRQWYVDPVVVERLVSGTPVRSNPAERRAAAQRLATWGLSARQIGERLHVTKRAAERILQTIREQQVAA